MLHIKNAVVCDGTGAPSFPGELLIRGETIELVSRRPLGHLDAQVLDAGGRTVTPGFIDAHRHCDLAALYDPEFGKLELSQGITTAVMGNCGLAPSPCLLEYRQELYDFLEPCLGKAPKESFFPLLSHFFDALEQKKLPLNLGVLAATGAVTVATKGFSPAVFSDSARRRAETYLRDAFTSGALGLSCGIMYQPECWTETGEFVRMARLAGEYGAYLTAHIRGEGNSLEKSVREVLDIGKKAEVPVNISHFKVTGLQNHGHGLERAIEVLERARAEGRDVTADAYPYTGGSTTILSLVPPSVLEAAGEDLPDFLGTARGQDLLASEIAKEFPGWDNMVVSIGWERIIISSVIQKEDSRFTGMDFCRAARLAGVSEAALFCALLHGNRGKVGVILMSMAQKDVDRVLCLPYVSLISDGLYGGGDSPHPRLYGAFPKFLREYVREKKLLTMEEAVRKMTALPAKRLGLKNRGVLKPGSCADLLVFDPEEFTDRATFAQPKQLAEGLFAVLVGGVPSAGSPPAAKPQQAANLQQAAGRVLKRQ